MFSLLLNWLGVALMTVYDLDFGAPDVAVAGRDLARLVVLWLDEVRAGRTALTWESYRVQVGRVLRWWEAAGGDCDWLLSRSSLLELAHWLNAQGLGWHAQNDALRRLRQVLRWAWQRGIVSVDASAWVPAPLGELPGLRRRVLLDDLAALLVAANQGAHGARDGALLALLIGTGLRRAEAAGLAIEDVSLDASGAGSLHVRQAKRVRGRGLRGRMVAVDEWTGARLLPWLAVRPVRGPLWVRAVRGGGFANAPLGIGGVGRVVRRAAAVAGVRASTHDLRRAYATYNALQRRDDQVAGRLLMRQLGHAHMDMTAHYILDDVEDRQAVLRSPLAD